MIISDLNSIRTIKDGIVTTISGAREAGFLDGPAAHARFDKPAQLAVDQAGSIYIADSKNNRIRMIKDGLVLTIAGNGHMGSADGPALAASFSRPTGVACDPSGGAVFVADSKSRKIRKIVDGIVSTVAGTDNSASVSENGPALDVRLGYVTSLTLVSNGDLYFTECDTNKVRKLDSKSGLVSTVANSGRQQHRVENSPDAAILHKPMGIAVHPTTGTVFVTDSYMREIGCTAGQQGSIRCIEREGGQLKTVRCKSSGSSVGVSDETWKESGSPAFFDPVGLALSLSPSLDSNTLYIVDGYQVLSLHVQ